MNDDSRVNAEKYLPPLNVLVSRVTFVFWTIFARKIFEYAIDRDRELIIVIYKIRFQSEY